MRRNHGQVKRGFSTLTLSTLDFTSLHFHHKDSRSLSPVVQLAACSSRNNRRRPYQNIFTPVTRRMNSEQVFEVWERMQNRGACRICSPLRHKQSKVLRSMDGKLQKRSAAILQQRSTFYTYAADVGTPKYLALAASVARVSSSRFKMVTITTSSIGRCVGIIALNKSCGPGVSALIASLFKFSFHTHPGMLRCSK